MKPFHPKKASTVNIAATSTSNRVALANTPTGEFQVRIHNKGPGAAFIARGDGTITADTTSNLPIPAGAIEVFTFLNITSNPVTHVAAVCASGETATVYFSTGEGV